MARKCDLYPCLKKGDSRAIEYQGAKITRNDLLRGKLRDGTPLDADAPVRVVDSQGRSVASTVGVVTGLVSGEDLARHTRRVLPSSHDPVRGEGGHLHGYYERLNAQHFDMRTSVGSVFTEMSCVDELVEFAVLQGFDLNTVDHSQEIADRLRGEGWDEEEISATLWPGVRYVLVPTPGLNGLAYVGELVESPDVALLTVRAERTKPGVPLSLTVGRSDGGTIARRPESVATMVLGPDPKDSSQTRLFTAHPGLPVRPALSDPVDVSGRLFEEGEEISLGEFTRRFPDCAFLKIDAARVAPVAKVSATVSEYSS